MWENWSFCNQCVETNQIRIIIDGSLPAATHEDMAETDTKTTVHLFGRHQGTISLKLSGGKLAPNLVYLACTEKRAPKPLVKWHPDQHGMDEDEEEYFIQHAVKHMKIKKTLGAQVEENSKLEHIS